MKYEKDIKIVVCGVGAITAIGLGAEEILGAIGRGERGVGHASLFDTRLDVPVAEVKMSNDDLKRLLGLDPRKTISRTALLGMAAAGRAVDDARIPQKGVRVGIVSSTSVGGMDLTENFYREFSQDDSRGRLRDVVGHDCSYSTRMIADYCGTKHFSSTISTACSSAANAVIMGAGLLKRDMLDYVVVGGTDALCRFTLNGFNSLMILDKEPCRPFDRDRSGLNLGEGAGYIVLAREGVAEREYCYLSGYANANDAFHQTASSEEGEGAYRAMIQALEMSGLKACDVSYVNVHGTGTQNNDASEGAAMIRIFGDDIPPFSSTKPFTGHTLAAAGGVEAVLSVWAIERGLLYPSLGFVNSIEGFGLIPQAQFVEGAQVKNVMSNSFGFGGNNSTLVFMSK